MVLNVEAKTTMRRLLAGNKMDSFFRRLFKCRDVFSNSERLLFVPKDVFSGVERKGRERGKVL
jgi:hypothetical protein